MAQDATKQPWFFYTVQAADVLYQSLVAGIRMEIEGEADRERKEKARRTFRNGLLAVIAASKGVDPETIFGRGLQDIQDAEWPSRSG